MYTGQFFKINDFGQMKKMFEKEIIGYKPDMYLPIQDRVEVMFQKLNIDYPATKQGHFIRIKKIGKKVIYLLQEDI